MIVLISEDFLFLRKTKQHSPVLTCFLSRELWAVRRAPKIKTTKNPSQYTTETLASCVYLWSQTDFGNSGVLVCLCLMLQTYGLSGESLRSLTEKLRAVSHTLVTGIQGRWCRNSYNGRSANALPAGILQVVVEVITSAKGLFTLLNRLGEAERGT